ncbi:MAG: hypothetical protein OXJ64_05275, partial [Boseongicola sp.]|nr:hypothetical protein [Boseongicola sp.]
EERPKARKEVRPLAYRTQSFLSSCVVSLGCVGGLASARKRGDVLIKAPTTPFMTVPDDGTVPHGKDDQEAVGREKLRAAGGWVRGHLHLLSA